uniref:Uncharacterized protein n=1 Tax=Rhizophora mucronata TaxID=61149 RepID=A0A2P2Q612_RHIMU
MWTYKAKLLLHYNHIFILLYCLLEFLVSLILLCVCLSG